MNIPSDKRERVKKVFAKLADKNLPQKLYDVIGGWFLSKDSEQEREEALSEYFDENFDYTQNPSKQAYKSFDAFSQKAGLRKPRPIVIPLYKRMTFRYAAAVLALTITISGSVFLLIERVEDTVEPNRIAIVTAPAGAAVSQTPQEESATVLAENQTHTLPDNSTVRLGAGSRIAHSEDFEGNRNVELKGEAHFNVTKAKDESDRFTVHTDHFDIKVLGTQFNVHSPAGEAHSVIDLYHGSVEVLAGGKTYRMKPTDHLRYDHITRETTLTTIPYGQLRYDEMPGLVFDKTPITEVWAKIGRDFGVRFTIEGEIPQEQTLVEGDLTSFHSLGEIMSALQKLSEDFDYLITDNEIKIKTKNI